MEAQELAFLKRSPRSPFKRKNKGASIAEVPGSIVSQAVWCVYPIEFPARQVYSPASSKVTLCKNRISSSLSVVLTPAVYRGKIQRQREKEGKTPDKPNSQKRYPRQMLRQISEAVHDDLRRCCRLSLFPYSNKVHSKMKKMKRYPSPGSYSVP